MLYRRNIFLSFSILLLTSILSLSKVNSQVVREYKEFDFDREIAVDYAKISLKEFFRNSFSNSEIESLDNYNLGQPYVSSVYSTDCHGKTVSVVFVAFFAKEKETYAQATLEYDVKDGYFIKSLRRGASIGSPQDEVEQIRNATQNYSDYWNCDI